LTDEGKRLDGMPFCASHTPHPALRATFPQGEGMIGAPNKRNDKSKFETNRQAHMRLPVYITYFS